MKKIRYVAAAALAAAFLVLPAGAASAGPCHGEVCPPCYTAQIDALWHKLTGLGPLFLCPR